MTQEEINKAYENRWRIKSEHIEEKLEQMLIQYRVEYVKELCRDFFEAGIMLADNREISVIEDSISNFREWWEMYDKKRGKEKCYLKWKRLTQSEQNACIKATPAYVASTPDKTYRKDPLTYLNGKCWNDEIIMRDNGKSTSPDAAERLTDILIG